MGIINRTAKTSSPEGPTPDFVATGTSAYIGNYYENGTYGGLPAYEREDGAYWIFMPDYGWWYLYDEPNMDFNLYFYCEDDGSGGAPTGAWTPGSGSDTFYLSAG